MKWASWWYGAFRAHLFSELPRTEDEIQVGQLTDIAHGILMKLLSESSRKR